MHAINALRAIHHNDGCCIHHRVMCPACERSLTAGKLALVPYLHLVASYSNSLHIAHASLQTKGGDSIIDNMRSQLLSVDSASPDLPITVIMVGGGSHHTGHHWYTLPSCGYIRKPGVRQYPGMRHKLSHCDDPNESPACVKAYQEAVTTNL